jgi:hypothetical protein
LYAKVLQRLVLEYGDDHVGIKINLWAGKLIQ